jgi:hypothetical protein
VHLLGVSRHLIVANGLDRRESANQSINIHICRKCLLL